MIPVIELLRVSTEGQAAEGTLNLAAQHTVNQRTAMQYSLDVVQTIEIIESGAEVARTPQMAQLLEVISSGRARGIVVAEYSRLFRPDRWTDLAVLQTFHDYSAQIYLPGGPIDLETEPGFVQATVSNMVSALERKRIRDRMHRGKEELRRRGKNVHPICLPFGVSYTPQAGWGYTADIELVKEIFRLFLAGEFNMEEIGRRVGVNRTKALYVLANPIYSGWRVYDQKRDPSPRGKFLGKGYRKSMKRAADEVIRVRLPLEPIISEEDFARAQVLLEERQNSIRKPRVKDPLRYLYRGFSFCTCGQQLYGIYASRNLRHYYMCRSQSAARRPAGVEKCDNMHMDKVRMETELDRVICDQLMDPNVLAPAIESYNDSTTDTWRKLTPDQDTLRGKLIELDRKRSRVVEAFVDGAIGTAERDQRLKTIDTEIAAVRDLVLPMSAPQVMTQEDIRALITTFAEWAMLDRGSKRRMLESLKPAFYVHRYIVRGAEIPVATSFALRRGVPLVATNRITRSGLYVPLCA